MTRLSKILSVLASLFAGCALALAMIPLQRGHHLKRTAALRIEPEVLDLGPVWYGTARSFEVKLRNLSNSAVRITSVTSGCSCAAVEVTAPEIAGGGLEWLRGTLRADKPMGTFQEIIAIAIASPQPEVLPVRIQGTVVSRVRISPDVLTLRPGTPGGGQTSGTIGLSNTFSGVLEFEPPRTNVDGVRLELDALRLAPGESTSLHVFLTRMFLDTEDFVVKIPCDNDAEKTVNVSVRIEPHDGLEVRPRKVEFGVVTHGMLRSRMPLMITVSGASLPGQQLAVRSLPPYLKVAAIEDVTAQQQRILFDFREEWNGFDLGGEAVIEVQPRGGNGSRGTVVVRFHGFLAD